ncbi:MAG: hypothetical protein E6K54_07190 [Gammaproteobacteria bacterium]|nr:MAG: hypothetical protein E6K54_07190 [Gammaproteobacteria bacterium]
MLKHVIPSQQKYLAKNDLKQGEVRIARDESMTEKLQLEKRPFFYKNLENNNVIPGTYAHTELFQAGIIIEHVESQKQHQARDIIKTAFYMPIFSAKLPGNIEQNKTYTFTTFGK